MSEAEQRELELAENLNRKDLTAEERSRTLVTLVETAAEVIAEEYGVAESDISERIGVPQKTINNATRHVAAIDAYPELAPMTQPDALKIASKLDAMPDDVRTDARAKVMQNDPSTLAALTDRPPCVSPAVDTVGMAPDDAGRRNAGSDWEAAVRPGVSCAAVVRRATSLRLAPAPPLFRPGRASAAARILGALAQR